MEGDYVIPLKVTDGKILQMEVKQKKFNGKRRKVKTWTAQEDCVLLKLYQEYPKKWATIASLMHDRNQNQCLHRYRRLSQLGANRKIWSSQQDQTVKKLIKKFGKNWKLLSQTLGSKTGKQIRERFINKLDPKIKKEEWTDDQDRKLIELYSQLGSKWSQISKRIIGRPQNKIKNRFYSFIQKNYDIKYKVIDHNQIKRSSLVQIQINNQNQQNYYNHTNKYQFPSINQIDLDIKQNSKENINFNSRIYLRSLIKIQQQSALNNRYRSIHQLTSHNQFANENDLLYLSPH